jgi:hypothetical protein
MTTSKGTLVEQRVVFDCPKCGVHHDGPLAIEVDSETMDWDPGFPLEPISVFARQTLATSACGDVFVTRSVTDEPTFEMTLIQYPHDRPTVLRVVPRHEGSGDDGAGEA